MSVDLRVCVCVCNLIAYFLIGFGNKNPVCIQNYAGVLCCFPSVVCVRWAKLWRFFFGCSRALVMRQLVCLSFTQSECVWLPLAESKAVVGALSKSKSVRFTLAKSELVRGPLT